MANSVKDSIKQAQDAITLVQRQLVEVNAEVIKIANSASLAAKEFSTFKTPKQANNGLKNIKEGTEQINALYKEQERLEKALVASKAKLELATESTNKAVTENRTKLQQQNKAIKEAAKLSSSLSSEYEKQQIKLNQLIRKQRELKLSQELGNKLTKKQKEELERLTKQIQKLDNVFKKVDGSSGRFQRNVGNYPKGLKAAASAARSLASAMGLVGGAFLAISVVKDAFTRIRNFDKSMQNLSGILRVSRKDLKDLEKEIISVAGSSVRTSNEIAELANSLTTLGKTKEEVKALLSPVTDLSLGLNVAADEAGEFLVQMLNTFGASTDEAAKYADTIATIRTSTSLDFQRMRDSFQYIAPIAKILNKDLADVGSLIGILSDNGLKAESAGRLLATGLQRLAKDGKTLEQALLEINTAQANGVKETELLLVATKLFGVQAAKIGITLANNTDKIDENAEAIRNNSGALNDLVKQQLSSLDAKLKILDSTWEELILTVDNGTGSISTAFKGFIDLLTTAIKNTTELEKAQTKLNEIGVESNGWRTFFNLVLPGLKLLTSDYEKAEEAQLGFNKANKDLNDLTIESIQLRKEDLVLRFLSGELSEKEKKAYLAQIRVLEQSMKGKRIEREELVKTAKELGYAGQAYEEGGKLIEDYYENAEQASSRELKLFIAANEKKKKILEGLVPPERKKEGRRKAIETNTSESTAKKQAKDALEILETVKESFKNDISFNLPEINKAQLEAFSKKINEEITKGLRVDLAKEQVEESLGDLFKGLEEVAGINTGVLDSFFDQISAKGEKTFEDIAEIAKTSLSIIGGAGETLFQSNIDRYSDEIEANNEYYSALIDNENLADEDKERLEKDRKAKEKELQKKKEKEQQKAFLFNQALSVAEIGINLAKTISAINLAAAAIDTITPFAFGASGLAYRSANLPLAIGSAAAQTALVLAKSIPKFAEGGTMKNDGLMQINDHSSGRLEVVERNGQLLMTNEKNAIVEGKKGDVIHKDAKTVFDNISDEELIGNVEKYSMLATLQHQSYLANRAENNRLINTEKINTDRIVNAIKGQKTKFNIHNTTKLSSIGYLRALKQDF